MSIKNEIQQEKDPNTDYGYFLKIIGKHIQKEREKAGIKNAVTFANMIDIAESQYREYERGETDMKLSTFIRIFKGLGISAEDLFNVNFFSTKEKASYIPGLATPDKETQVRNQVRISNGASAEENLDTEDIKRLITTLITCFRYKTKNEILKAIDLSYKTAKFSKVFKLLIGNGWIEMKHPDSPNTPNQSYRTTPAGKAVLQT